MIRKFFSDVDELLILSALLWSVTVTVLRAIRWPNDYAEAQWLISYGFGFIKRGLIGTLFSPFANENAELAIQLASASLFVIFCIVLLWICMRIVKNNKLGIGSMLIALLFLTSPYMVMSAHLNGYFDNILIIISVISCVLVKQNKIFVASLVVSAGFLIQEIILVAGFPSVVFFALLHHIQQTKPTSAAQLIISFVVRYKILLMMPVLTFLCIYLNQAFFLNPEVLAHQLILHVSQFDFVENGRNIWVPRYIVTPFSDFLSSESPNFIARITQPTYVLHTGLPMLIMLGYGWSKIQPLDFKWGIFFILVVIILLPLLLNIIAWDTSRIWTYPLVVALLGLWAITESMPAIQSQERGHLLFFAITLTVMVFQFFMHTILMDELIERFSNGERMLLYAPTLILFAVFLTRKYIQLKRSV